MNIAKRLGLNVKKDWKAIEILEQSAREPPKSFPTFTEVIVVGPNVKSNKVRGGEVIAVDGAVKLLAETPKVLVTDLDGADIKDVETVLMNDGWVFLHVHGDNYENAIRVYSYFKWNDKLIPTVQLPSNKALCLPAFSDGDRAILIALELAERVKVVGFDKMYQNPITKKRLIHPFKERKVQISRRYEVVTWLRYYGVSPEQVIG